MISPYHAEEDDDYYYVDVMGRGTVAIEAHEKGIMINVFPLHVVDDPIFSLLVPMSTLVKEVSDA